MNTNELIESLARELAPVKPLAAPGRRAAVWLLAAVAYVALLAIVMRGGQFGVGGARALLPQVAGIVASFVAARAAFAAIVPGRPAHAVGALLLAAVIWLGTLFLASTWQMPASAIVAAGHEWTCVALIVVGGAPLMWVLAAMLKRGAPLRPTSTAALAALAVGTVANVGACWSLPHGSNEITLVWHGGAVLALVLAGVLVGRLLFTWSAAARRVPTD
jgi:hypothetical protein